MSDYCNIVRTGYLSKNENVANFNSLAEISPGYTGMFIVGTASYITDGVTVNKIGSGSVASSVYNVDPTSAIGIAQQIQAFHDAMPSSGGTIFIPPKSLTSTSVYEWTAQVTLTKPMYIYSLSHKGGATANAQQPPVTLRIASGIKAIYCGQAGALFCGVTLRDLNFNSADGTGWAIYNNNMSHCTYENITINGLTSGVGIEFVSNAGQYSRITNVYIHGCATGIKGTDYNGVIIDKCYIDPAINAATPVAGSVGIINANSGTGDWSITNTQIQGCDTCIDVYGQNARIELCRFETFNTGIILRGDRQDVGAANSFNNFIYNSSGICVDIKATATFANINPYVHGSTSSEPTRDAGTNTIRHDAIYQTRCIPSISATSSFTVGDVIEGVKGVSFYLRKSIVHSGDTAMAVDAVNFWTVQLQRLQSGGAVQGIGGSINSTAGWAVNSKNAFNTATNNNVINAGEQVRAVFTKTGAPPALTECSVTFILVPY